MLQRERENELLRKQWSEGDIERVARLCRTFHSAIPASATQAKSKSAWGRAKEHPQKECCQEHEEHTKGG